MPTNAIWVFLERYKLHHVLFWAGYHFAWWTLFAGSVNEVLESLAKPYTIVKYLGYVVYQAVGVYFCLYVLIPKLLQKEKYLIFFVSTIAVVVLMSTVITGNYFVAATVANANVYELFNISPATPFSIFRYNAFPSCIAATTLGMSIKLAKIWVVAQKRQQILEKEKLETELKFLKSQFNPHFLFNTINSIFVLINKNPKMASDSLVKFSNLLRYQLYDCNSSKIPLKNELAYIESFIELESLRQNQNFELKVNIQEFDESLTIAPFILLPFIENAFKHLSEDQKLKKWIHLNIILEDGALQFELENSADFELRHTLPNEAAYSGLGLQNVKRRLAIIYPNEHILIITKGKDTHTIKLQLQLEEEASISLTKVSG
ncbi:histidine kinase [Flagellimonas sp. HMM57]|uniref:sensor histidine kinase n=1 Tax=unclassified Flagellimonas TaxID=2644544 RepID=UPI0013D50B77|nr:MULTISPECIES: histidine kinase [unclassified Flagellimonas]UII77080.1 histidine kinase [Flagellimonas sp. HMM57]